MADSTEADVLIIGSGVAGLAAAISAKEQGAGKVVLVSKGPITSRSASYYSAGRMTAELPSAKYYDPAGPKGLSAAEEKKEVRRWLSDSPLSDVAVNGALAREVMGRIHHLETYGITMDKFAPDDNRVNTVNSSYPRGGAAMLGQMGAVAARQGVKLIPHFAVLGLLTPGGDCGGAYGLAENGSLKFLKAKVVVLAAGGAGRIFEWNQHPQGISGDAYAMLLKAGVTLTNLEFIRHFPMNIRDSQFPAHRSSKTFYDRKGLRAINQRGEDIYQKHLGQTIQQALKNTYTRFVTMSWILAKELRDGDVVLDLTNVEELKTHSIPELIANWDGSPGLWKYLLTEKKVPITPRTQAFHGGAKVGPDMFTGVKGLFAAGEAIDCFMDLQAEPECGLGALSAALVSGHIAGREAAKAAAKAKPAVVAKSYVTDRSGEVAALRKAKGDVAPEKVIQRVGALMTKGCGSLRSEASLQEALKGLAAVEADLSRLKSRTTAELLAASEARSMVLTASALLQAASLRKESRAEHYREDFPKRDDKRWARQIHVRLDRKGALVVEAAAPALVSA